MVLVSIEMTWYPPLQISNPSLDLVISNGIDALLISLEKESNLESKRN